MNSEDKLQYFYEEIKEKLSKNDKNKKKRNYSFIGFLAFIAFFTWIPYDFPYEPLLSPVMIISLYLLWVFFMLKVKKSPLSEHEYIFYHLKNIQTSLSKEKPTEAEKELKSLIQYVRDIKEKYRDNPFTNTIFKNLVKFEKILLENLYPSLTHSNDEIAKKTEHYLKDVIKLVKEGNLNAISDIDITGFDSEEKSLEELYEPTRVKKIYGKIKELFSIPRVKDVVSFSFVALILLFLDFFIARGSNWELVKGDFIIIILASATIVGQVYRKTERHT